jgi:uncharacterized membrane protein
MVNEIPINLFSILIVADFVLILYTILKINKPAVDSIITAAISAFLSFICANMILNGNVVAIQSTGTEYSYIPIQSLPLHYILLMFGSIMSVVAVFFVYSYISNYLEKEKSFSALGEWKL